MLIDCEDCRARGAGCRDCVVSVVLDRRPPRLWLDAGERAALTALAGGGLVPQLRHRPGLPAARAASSAEPDEPDTPAGQAVG